MTALYMDGFAHYGPFSNRSAFQTGGSTTVGGPGRAAMLSGPWAQVESDIAEATFVLSPAPFGSPAGSWCASYFDVGFDGYSIRRVLPAAKVTTFTSFRYAVSSLPSSGGRRMFICDWRDGSNNVLYTLKLTTTGGIELWSGPTTTLVASSLAPVVVPENFHYFEIEYVAGGDITVRVDDPDADGQPALTFSGLSSTHVSQNSFIGYYPISPFVSANSMVQYITDLYVRDNAGTVNNSWLGDQRIATLFVNSDTAISGWTPSYYKEFGAGILQLSAKVVGGVDSSTVNNATSILNPTAYLSAASAVALDIGNADFTLETMIRFSALPNTGSYSTIFNRWDTANNKRSYRLILGDTAFNNGCLQLDTSTDGTSSTIATPIVYPWQPVLNTWYHLALVRAAGDLLLFVDGVQFGVPIADSRTYYSGGTEPLSIGMEVQGTGFGTGVVANTNMIGYLDETRFTNGVGRYTAAFTPPAAAFPRGGSDPDWSQVVLLMGYDSNVLDESSYARTIHSVNGAQSFTPSDGPAVGAYSTVNKSAADDNTFISAALTSAMNILTMTSQPTNGNIVTLGTKDGSTPAVYTFRNSISTAFDVLIDTTAQGTLTNLLNAINSGSGSGTKYGAGTTANFDVTGVGLPAGQIEVVANVAGTGGNSIPSTSTGIAAVWDTTTLSGGVNIPGPSNFLFSRPPPNTTIISAMQTIVRALKTDAGTARVQSTLVGPLGGTIPGTDYALSVSPSDYPDIIETDPDTSGPLSPTTIINGQFQVNRTA